MMKFKYVLTLCVMVFGSATATLAQDLKCEPEKAKERYPNLSSRTLLIGADPQTPPYVFRANETSNDVRGIDADLAKAVLSCVGLKYEFKLGSWSGMLPAVVAGQIDALWNNTYYSAERAQQADFITYMAAATGALTQAGNPSKIHSVDDLCGKRVTVGLGTVEEKSMRSESDKCVAAGKSAMEFLVAPDFSSGARLISGRRADVFLDDLGLVEDITHKNKSTFEVVFFVKSGFKAGVVVKNNNEELIKAIETGLKIVQANGTQKKIFEEYGVDSSLILPAESLRQ